MALTSYKKEADQKGQELFYGTSISEKLGASYAESVP